MSNNNDKPIFNPITKTTTIVTPPRVAIPEPGDTKESHRDCIVALKQAVEQMTNTRGVVTAAMPSWGDLVNLGLISITQVPTK
jgi:hypothetical protein